MSEYIPYRSIVEEAKIVEWEMRSSEEEGKGYVVYLVQLTNGENEWNVLRRFSDFVKFDAEIKKIRPMLLEVQLPPKHFFYTLTQEPDEKFIESRKRDLCAYLDKLIRTVGMSDIGFWNHPLVMTFFDIPLAKVGGFHESEIENVSLWDREMASTFDALEKSKELCNTRLLMIEKGLDSLTYTKNLRRQINNIQRHLDRLQTGLLNIQKNPITGQLQLETVRERKMKFEKARLECIGLLDHIQGINEADDEKDELLAVPQKTPPTPTKPAPGTILLPDDIAEAIRLQKQRCEMSPDRLIHEQQEHMSRQDQQIDLLAEIAKRNRETAKLINKEVEEHNRLLAEMAGQTDEANAKISIGQRRVKKI